VIFVAVVALSTVAVKFGAAIVTGTTVIAIVGVVFETARATSSTATVAVLVAATAIQTRNSRLVCCNPVWNCRGTTPVLDYLRSTRRSIDYFAADN